MGGKALGHRAVATLLPASPPDQTWRDVGGTAIGMRLGVSLLPYNALAKLSGPRG